MRTERQSALHVPRGLGLCREHSHGGRDEQARSCRVWGAEKSGAGQRRESVSGEKNVALDQLTINRLIDWLIDWLIDKLLCIFQTFFCVYAEIPSMSCDQWSVSTAAFKRLPVWRRLTNFIAPLLEAGPGPQSTFLTGPNFVFSNQSYYTKNAFNFSGRHDLSRFRIFCSFSWRSSPLDRIGFPLSWVRCLQIRLIDWLGALIDLDLLHVNLFGWLIGWFDRSGFAPCQFVWLIDWLIWSIWICSMSICLVDWLVDLIDLD